MLKLKTLWACADVTGSDLADLNLHMHMHIE